MDLVGAMNWLHERQGKWSEVTLSFTEEDPHDPRGPRLAAMAGHLHEVSKNAKGYDVKIDQPNNDETYVVSFYIERATLIDTEAVVSPEPALRNFSPAHTLTIEQEAVRTEFYVYL